MKKWSLQLILFVCCLTFTACGEGTNTQNTEESTATTSSSHTKKTTRSEASWRQERTSTTSSKTESLYFESDEVVNQFFTDYNAIAEIPIPAEEIDQGNIRTKALVYIDDLSLEVINAPDYLSISMGSSNENEGTKLYAIFRDTIKALKGGVTEDDIQTAWNTVHEPGYMKDYDFNGGTITYKPASDYNGLRIDLEFPLE